MTTCAFTGHRVIKDSHRKNLTPLLHRAISYAYGRGCRRFIAGGAVGFDTAAERAVLRFRIDHPDVRLVLFLPCQNQDAEWSAAQRDSYEYILSSADEVRYVCDEYDGECMKKRNQAMADECDMLIAYVSRDISGSAQTVRMAKKQNKEVYNLFFELDKPGNM